MNENQKPNHDLLEEAIHAFQRMSVPERPFDAEVLSQFGTRQGDLSQPSRIPLPSQRRFRMHVIVSSTAAALLLSAGLALFLRNDSPPEPAPVAVTDPARQAGGVAGGTPREENRVKVERSSLADVPRLENQATESQVIVVATAKSSAPAPLPEIPGDSPEFLIQFTVKRVLKGKLAAKVITTRTSAPPDKIIGQDWVVCLSAEYLAGKHQSAPLTSAKFEARFKEILAEDKK
jgi:hypothetical protein